MERKRLEILFAVASYSTVCLKFHYNYSLFLSVIHPNNSFHECVTVIVILKKKNNNKNNNKYWVWYSMKRLMVVFSKNSHCLYSITLSYGSLH